MPVYVSMFVCVPHQFICSNIYPIIKLPSTVHESIASSPGLTITFSDIDFIDAPSVKLFIDAWIPMYCFI
jgi:hypothetical protein